MTAVHYGLNFKTFRKIIKLTALFTSYKILMSKVAELRYVKITFTKTQNGKNYVNIICTKTHSGIKYVKKIKTNM